MKRASTLLAPVEARAGQSGKLSNINLCRSPCPRMVCRRPEAEQNHKECAEDQHRRARSQLQNSLMIAPYFPVSGS